MTADTFLFWILATITAISGILVVSLANPIFCALSLAMTMVGVAAMFVTLDAYFLAGVQLIVYAGAVMVLFVMVLMLFDLNNEVYAYSRGRVTGFLKLAGAGLFLGLILGSVLWGGVAATGNQLQSSNGMEAARNLGEILLTKYLFGFEALGVLLLVVAVGAVALARSRGGTHARN